jgi:hypothetical protein
MVSNGLARRGRAIALAALLACVSLVPSVGLADAHSQAAPKEQQVALAKSCSSGYTHAVTPGGHKCLRAGQFCSRSHSYQVVYHHHGFHCKANRHLGYR